MKRKLIFMVSIALIMAFAASVAGIFSAGAASVPSTGSDRIDAVYSTVTVDGTMNAKEYIIDTEVNGHLIGAAWNLAAKEIYFVLYKQTNGLNFTMDIGSKTVSGSFADGKAEGIDGMKSKLSYGALEFSIPITALELKYDGFYGVSDLEITFDGDKEPAFSGKVVFTDYDIRFTYNAYQSLSDSRVVQPGVQIPSATEIPADGSLRVDHDALNKYTLYDATDDEVATRAYLVTGGVSFEDQLDFHYECDLNVVSMPYSQIVKDDPGSFAKTEPSRIWFALKFGASQQVYINIINMADGLVLLVQKSNKNPDAIPLGVEAGETFTLGLDYSKAAVLNVRVNGKFVGAAMGCTFGSSQLGSSKGVFNFNIQRNTDLPIGGATIVECSNISAGLKVADYNLDSLLALSTVTVNKNNIEKDETTKAESKEYNVSGVDVLSKEGSVVTGDAATTTDETSSKGCKSSFVGIGAVMTVGAALITTIAVTKKKED